MAATTGALEHKTRANHYKGRLGVAMGGHLYLRSASDPALIFRAHPFFQKRYEVQIRLFDITSVTENFGRARVIVKLANGTSDTFLLAGGTELMLALEKECRAARRGTSVGPSDDEGRRYWATGTYEPERYYRETRGWSPEYREYVRDAYGDLDTYDANRPD